MKEICIHLCNGKERVQNKYQNYDFHDNDMIGKERQNLHQITLQLKTKIISTILSLLNSRGVYCRDNIDHIKEHDNSK